MFRIALSAVVLALIMCLVGCGSSNGTNGGAGVVTVNIQSDRVSPENVIVSVSDQVKWINATSSPKQVISGTLDETGSQLVEHIVIIGNTGFTPSAFEANFGDTIKFNNLTASTFNLEIVDTGGQSVANISLLAGRLSEDVEFPSAGKFTYRKQGNSLFDGTVTLFGQPNPSGQFQSPVLLNGGTFIAQFDVQEFIPYFVLDVNNPNRSFITGSVRIQ